MRKGSPESKSKSKSMPEALAWLTQAATSPTKDSRGRTYRYEMRWYLLGDTNAVTTGLLGA